MEGEKVTKRRKKLSKAACQRWWKVKQREGVICFENWQILESDVFKKKKKPTF